MSVAAEQSSAKRKAKLTLCCYKECNMDVGCSCRAIALLKGRQSFRFAATKLGESFVRIVMAKNKNSVEKRRFTRFEVEIPVQCKPVTPGRRRARKELVYATIKNISRNGILLEWPGEHRLPQFLKLGIKILPSSKPIECTARKVWAKEMKSSVKGKREVVERYDLGLSFVKDRYSKAPMLISRRTNFYWDIFERAGYIEAYLLHRGSGKESEENFKDEEDA